MLDQIASRPGDLDESESGLSRRTFLQSGAAAGGGLLLSLSLPFATGDAEERPRASRPTPSSASAATGRSS